MKVGDLIRYKTRYIGEQFVVVGVRPRRYRELAMRPKIKCVSVQTLKETRWSCSSTVEKIA